MSLRNIIDVENEIQECKNALIALENEIAKIKLCEITEISENQLSKIKDFKVTCSYEELSPSEYAKKGVEIPKPHRDHTPSYNREQADEWVESALTDETIKAKIRQEVRDVRRTIVDNVERVSYDQFEQELKVAVDKFNTHIDDEPYVVVIMANGGSEQWAYEIASQWLKNKPEGFAYIKSGYSRSSEDVEQSLQPFFDKGIRKVVVFDDAAYSGTGITEEAGFPVARQYQKFVEGKGGYDEQPMEYIAVVSRATDGATQKFYSSSILNNYKDLENTPELIAGGRMQSVGQVVNWDQLNPAVRKHLVKRGIDDSQTLIYYEHKVPDSLSLPEQVSDRIYTAHQSHMSARSYSHDLYEPYKLTSDFSEKWREVGKEASVFIQLLSSIVQLLR